MIVERHTIIVIEEKPDYFIVRCGYCGGHGCSHCNYTGYRRLLVPKNWSNFEVGVYKCGYCGGTGCSHCDYVGAFVGRSPRLVCGYCGGHGCSHCKYRGSVWVGDIP